MHKISLYVLMVLLSFCEICFSQQIPNGRYFGQTPPGLTPEVFAPGIISLNNRYEYGLIFSPDLRECVIGVTNSNWSTCNLKFTKMADDSSWITPITAPFQGTGDGWFPSYTYAGSKIFFVSSRSSTYSPTNIWYSQRNDTQWDTPIVVPAPVNSNLQEWGSSLSNTDKLYFTRGSTAVNSDIYRSTLVNGQYLTIENIGAPINSSALEASPRIAPDESYLIFESDRAGGYGQSDLYISFFENGTWTTPRNLGPAINTTQIEDGGFVSPDGNYFFFNRRDAWQTSIQTEIWWVDAGILFNPTGIEDDTQSSNAFQLSKNFPDPFYPETMINYRLSQAARVEISVYNILGQKVITLVDDYKTAGNNSITWDGKNDAGQSMSSGVYIYQMRAGNFTASDKMLLMR